MTTPQRGHSAPYRVQSVVSAYERLVLESKAVLRPQSIAIPSTTRQKSPISRSSTISSWKTRRTSLMKAMRKPSTELWSRSESQISDEPLSLDPREQIVVYNRQSRVQHNRAVDAHIIPGSPNAVAAFKSLPEPCFEVTKKLSYRRRQPRTLKLSHEGIQNIKNGVVTSCHEYEKVNRLGLHSTSVIVISYDGKHDYFYEYPVPMQVIQAIVMRVSLVQVPKTEDAVEDYGVLFQKKVIDSPGVLEAISIMPVGRVSEIVAKEKIDGEQPARNRSDAVVPEPVEEEEEQVEAVEPEPSTGVLTSLKAKIVHKLSRKKQTAEEQLHSKISDVLTSKCGSIISSYLSQFPELEKDAGSAHALALNVRQFCDGLKDHVMEWCNDDLFALSDSILGSEATDIDVMRYSSAAIEQELDTVVLSHLRQPLWQSICASVATSENTISDGIMVLKSCKQSDFGIKDAHMSPSDWSLASQLLSELSTVESPADKLRVLLSAVHTIFTVFGEENKNRGHDEVEILSGDDFLPIFIFVVVQSDISRPLSNAEYCWQLSDPTVLASEGGYYISVFMAALEYIRTGADGLIPPKSPPPPPDAPKPYTLPISM